MIDMKKNFSPLPREIALVLRLLHRSHRPVLLGQVSSELSRSLDHVESLMTWLKDERLVRPLAPEEALAEGLDSRVSAWVLVNRLPGGEGDVPNA